MMVTHPRRDRALNILLLLGCLLFSATAARGYASGFWPQWRGPNRDNISPDTGLLNKWPAEGPPRVWEAKGLGAGYSSVSVADDKIFSMGDLKDGCYAIALDIDGKPLWQTKIGPTGGGPPGPRSTPTYEGGNLYVLGQSGDLTCLDARHGTIKWHKNLERDFAGAMMSGWGYSESVLVDADKVICTPGGPRGTLLALNKNTGQELWRTKDWTDSAGYASPIQVEMGGKRQYVQLTGESLGGVAASDGKVLWRTNRHGETAVIPTPVFRDNRVFVTSAYGIGCSLFKITDDNGEFSVTEVYANKNMKNHHGGVILVGDYVYGFSDPELVCLEYQTGKVKWKNRSVGKGALAYADRHLYLRAESSGAVALIEATPDRYHQVSQFTQPDRSGEPAWQHPVITGGRLYLRDQDVLLCYDLKTK